VSIAPSASTLIRALKKSASKKDATSVSRFIKTRKGQYGEGDSFLGIRMPVLRQLAKDNMDLSLTEAVNLLKSEFHEARMTALLILVLKFQQEDETT